MIKRSEKIAFMKVNESDETYKRMKGFTELSVSKNPKEYSRKYIDEDMERSAVVGYSPSMSYKFDADPNDPVHQVFFEVADKELLGSDTERNIVIVDVSVLNEDGSADAVMRAFSIIPSTEGDDSDTYTFSGSLKAAGEKVFGVATSNDSWSTITFEAE